MNMSGTLIKLEESEVYCVFLIIRLASYENKSIDLVAMAVTIQEVFVSMLLNILRYQIFGFTSSFYVW